MSEESCPDTRLARIRYRSHRGMLELDLLLQPFIEQKLTSLSDADRVLLEALLDSTDPDLYSWLMGFAEPSRLEYRYLIDMIRSCQA